MTNKTDQDFISRQGWGGWTCAEMADQADLRREKSVAAKSGDVRG